MLEGLAAARVELKDQLLRFHEKAFGKYDLEIRTQLMLCERFVAKLSEDKSFDPYLIKAALEAQYRIRRLDLPPPASDIPTPPTISMHAPANIASDSNIASPITPPDGQSASPSLGSKLVSTKIASPIEVASVQVDAVERASDSNEMVENVFSTLEELSFDEHLIKKQIDAGIVGLCHAYVELVAATAVRNAAVDEVETGIDLLAVMPTRTLELIKSVANILLNVSACQPKLMQAIDDGMLELLRTAIILNDYEVQTRLYQAMGNMLICGLPRNDLEEDTYAAVRRAAFEAGYFDILNASYENSGLFKIRRLCKEYLTIVYDH